MAGYREHEFDGPLPGLQPGVTINVVRRSDPHVRRPMMSSIGASCRFATMPHVDLDHDLTALAGAVKRILLDKYRPSANLLRAMSKRSRLWSQQFPKVPFDYDMSMYKFIDHSKYSGARKDELRETAKKMESGNYRMSQYVGSFGKDEQYPDMKHMRTINALGDDWKLVFGPVVHAMEEVVFKIHCFVKKIPVEKRFDHLMERLFAVGRDDEYTDHSSFENVFQPAFVEAITVPFYCAILENHPILPIFLKNYREAVIPAMGNQLRSKFFIYRGAKTRCSGASDTSFGNGEGNLFSQNLANELTLIADQANEIVAWLLIDDFEMCKRVDLATIPAIVTPLGEPVVPIFNNFVCEGDDGVASGVVKTDQDCFRRLGFEVKLDITADLSGNDFCSVVAGIMDRQGCTNPWKILGHLGWFGSSHINARRGRKMQLLRARAASQQAMYPAAPIAGSFARYVLRATRHVDMRNFVEKERYVGQWRMEQYAYGLEVLSKRLVVPPTSMETRCVVESRFGVLIPHQLELERYFDSLNDVVFLDHPLLRVYMPVKWQDYAARYELPRGDAAKSQLYHPLCYAHFDNWGPTLRRQLAESGVTHDQLGVEAIINCGPKPQPVDLKVAFW